MLDYEILSGDTLVGVWQNRQLYIVNETLLPLYLKNFSDADLWLETRAIDAHRANSRLLKKALRLSERDDLATVKFANGVTVTDNYWVRDIGSRTKYSEVSFDADYFKKAVAKSVAKLALTGAPNSFQAVTCHPESRNAELTNTGSFEKCWKNINGDWWLYKEADKNVAFSEVFIYHLCNELHIPCAEYQKEHRFVRTRDFTENRFNFEPAFSFMGDEENYALTLEKLSSICPEAVPDYIRMLFLDALVFNPDRHTANFGLLRNRDTGEFIGLAPCFDHNMALISKGYPTGKPKSDLLISLFNDLLTEYPAYKACLPTLTEENINKALTKTNGKVKAYAVKEMLMYRYWAVVRE